MNSIDQGKRIIQTSEKQLRQLVGDAANQGDYEAVLMLTEWASQLASLANGQTSSPKPVESKGSAAAPPAVQKANAPPAVQKAKATKATRKPPRKVSATSGYPKFKRLGSELVKIGWSKKSREEYQHRAPHHVLRLLAESFRDAGADERMVGVHDLIPLQDPSTSSEVPSYQVYLCIAWFREDGLIQQHGRQGYTIPNACNLPALVEESWTKLSENDAQ